MRHPLAAGALAGFLVLASPAYARWATKADADIMVSSQVGVIVHADGTYVETTAYDTEILNELGRARYGTQTHTYNIEASSMKVLEAWSESKGKREALTKSMIEDKPVASNVNGFDQLNRITIAFPKAEIGAKLHVKYVRTIKQVPVSGHFDDFFTFGTGGYQQAADIKFDSKLPLHLLSHDPEHILTIESKQDHAGWHVHIKLNRPSYAAVVDEPNSYRDLDESVWVAVSSSTTYDDIVKPEAPTYEKVISSPLPPLLQSIADKAKSGQTTIDKINLVTSGLEDAIRYMGDWRSVKAAFVPRPLATVAETRFGDCKDFSAATAAILRTLGIKAQAAWVSRGYAPVHLPNLSMLRYNHAITRVEADGRVYWIDATNDSSFAGGLYPDIADRDALVLDAAHPRLEHIPLPQPESGIWDITQGLQFTAAGDATVAATMTALGSTAIAYAGGTRYTSRDHFDLEFRKAIAGEHAVAAYHIEPYDLSSRVVHDTQFKGTFEIKSYAMRTSAGLALPLYPPALVSQISGLDLKLRATSLFIGAPHTLRYVERVHNASLVGHIDGDCVVSSPWLTAHRRIVADRGDLLAEDTLETRQMILPRSAMDTQEFKQLQTQLDHCMYSAAVVFTQTGRVAE